MWCGLAALEQRAKLGSGGVAPGRLLRGGLKQTAGQVLTEETFQYLVWMSRAVEKYARAYKFTIGDRLQASGLTLIETLVEATWTRERGALLRRAQMEIERQRILWRLSFELKLIAADSYEHAARSVDAIGRGVGGWRKANNAHAARQLVRADRELPGPEAGGADGDPG